MIRVGLMDVGQISMRYKYFSLGLFNPISMVAFVIVVPIIIENASKNNYGYLLFAIVITIVYLLLDLKNLYKDNREKNYKKTYPNKTNISIFLKYIFNSKLNEKKIYKKCKWTTELSSKLIEVLLLVYLVVVKVDPLISILVIFCFSLTVEYFFCFYSECDFYIVSEKE